MRNTSRLIASLCLLGCAACAQQRPAAVKPAPQPAEPRTEFRGMPFPPGPITRPDESRPGVGRFMLSMKKNPEDAANEPLYIMNGHLVGGTPYLRPEDVVSVEVLTREAAIARYGVDSPRTVIAIVTTWGQAREGR